MAANLEINLNTESKLHFNSLYLHTAMAAATKFYGREIEIFQVAEDNNSEGLTRRLQINDNSVFINQLIYSGNISNRLKYNAGAGVNYVIGKEPDRRIMMFPSIGNGMVQLGMGEGRNQRFNSSVTETAVLPKINVQYLLSADPEKISYLELGYDSRISSKDFSAPIYNYYWAGAPGTAPTFSVNDMHLDAYFNQENLSEGDFRLEHFNDTYQVRRNNHGIYADLIHKFGSKLTLNTGLRADNIYTEINYEVNRGADVGSNTIEGLFLSPSLNAKYELNEKNHIRTGVSRTYTLPQDKEISPFIYQGIDGNDNGNPNLEVSTNYNFDLKWDYYISSGELLTLNGFYKHISDPIARVDQGNSAGLRTYDNVSDHAVATGIELELRKSLFAIGQKQQWYAGLNASYIYTKVELDPAFFVQNTSSGLEGAAPYILNADVTYTLKTNRNLGITSALVLNYVSDKVHTIGTRGYNNLIEESFTTLDLVTSLGIRDNLRLTLKAKNLLNPEYKLSRKGTAAEGGSQAVITRSYRRGVLLDFGIACKF
ncbi:MAG: hypothetical protein EOO01_15470 [Chitinophagaceae bacterium]|nr:MAG: hypothetical protein EOO01_15470 [Chitinophagaceae bacterium]